MVLGAEVPQVHVREYRFHPLRKWRFDFAWPTLKVALEVEGGTFLRRGHTGGTHFESDCEKYSEAAILGWRVIRATARMVKDGRFLGLVERALDAANKDLHVHPLDAGPPAGEGVS